MAPSLIEPVIEEKLMLESPFERLGMNVASREPNRRI